MNFFQVFTPNLYSFFTGELAMATFANLAAQQTQNCKIVKPMSSHRDGIKQTRSQRRCDHQVVFDKLLLQGGN